MSAINLSLLNGAETEGTKDLQEKFKKKNQTPRYLRQLISVCSVTSKSFQYKSSTASTHNT